MTTERHDLPARSALQQAGVLSGAVRLPDVELRELPGLTILSLHSLDSETALAAALAPVGIVLPRRVNEAVGANPAVLCLRPGEWLLVSEGAAPDELLGRLEPRVDPSLTAALNLSDGLGAFRLGGAAAPWLLAKLSGLDFVAGAASGQHAARTRIGDIAVVLHFRPDAGGSPCFDLLVDRSLAPHLWALLTDAAPHASELFAAHGAAA